MDNSLSALVPSKELYYDTYVSRVLAVDNDNGETSNIRDFDLIETCHELRHNLLLCGPTGSAKTSFVYAYAAKVGLPVVNVACNGGTDVRQLLGGWHATPDGGFAFSEGPLVKGVREGAIILLNEINFMPPKIAASIYGLLDRRRTIYIPDAEGSGCETQVTAHKDTLVIADYNPNYIGTRPLNEALRNRFALKVNWDYEPAVEEELVQSLSLLEMAGKLRERVELGDLVTPVPTNLLMEFEELATTFGNKFGESVGFNFAVDNFIASYEDPTEAEIVKEVFALYEDRVRTDLGISPRGVNRSDSEGGQ